MTKVTDVDREAAVNHHRSVGRRALAGGITAGAFDNDTLVQQFASHREEATRELVEALERIANYEGGTDYTCQHGMRGIAKDALAKHTGGE